MKKFDARLLRSCVLLCLPTLVAVVIGAWFILFEVPKIVKEEKLRVDRALESASVELLQEPETSDFVWRRGTGIIEGDKQWEELFPYNLSWKKWQPISGTKKKEMWGWRTTSRGRVVWARGLKENDTLVYGKVVDIHERDWRMIFYVFGAFVFCVLIFVTVLGMKFFLDYIKARDDFMAATAHDLTTPLVAMRYMIGKNDAEATCLCERMLRLVANIKDFLRLGGKRAAPKLTKVDLISMYNEAYSLFREDYRDLFSGRDVVMERLEGVAKTGPIFVNADETLLVQIIWNLLGNDLKYAAPYGVVKVQVRGSGDFIYMNFVDEGKGMSASEMRKAFDRYYRAKTVLSSGKGGFGIGLSTSKEFAKLMGGNLEVRANSPKGCIFTLKCRADFS